MRKKIAALVTAGVLVLALWLFIDYFMLPAYSFQSSGTWMMLAFLLGLVGLVLGLPKGPRQAIGLGFLGFGGMTLLCILVGMGSALIWPGNAARFYELMKVEERGEGDFAKDFSTESNALLLPVIDKDISYKIAQGKMGPYGAQYQVLYDNFTQQTVRRGGKDYLVRVGPLDYNGPLVALNRGARGTAGYVEVDVITEAARLVEVEGGMKYTPGAVFSRDLMRRARSVAKTSLLGPYSFEIDDSGHPYWIIPILENKVGLFGGAEPRGILLIDAVSGKVEKLARGNEPAWLERAMPTDIVKKQANSRLSLKNGWINRDWGEKRDVFQISDGYNYVASSGADSGKIWFVSGVTSPAETDQTTVGLLMVDMRTKEARRYAMSGITEMRAMQIAQSDERVRAQTLSATWPIVTQVDGLPTYFMILKNEVQRQRFVFVDVESGNKVAMGESIEQAKVQFAGLSGRSLSADKLNLARISVLRVRENLKDGTLLFISKAEPSILYIAPLELGNGVRFLSPGDEAGLRYRDSASSQGQRFVQELWNISLGETDPR